MDVSVVAEMLRSDTVPGWDIVEEKLGWLGASVRSFGAHARIRAHEIARRFDNLCLNDMVALSRRSRLGRCASLLLGGTRPPGVADHVLRWSTTSHLLVSAIFWWRFLGNARGQPPPREVVEVQRHRQTGDSVTQTAVPVIAQIDGAGLVGIQ